MVGEPTDTGFVFRCLDNGYERTCRFIWECELNKVGTYE